MHWSREEIDDGVVRVVYDRPPVNAMPFDEYDALRRSMQHLAEDPDLRVVILRGAGERAFIAGHDVDEFLELDQDTAAEGLARARLAFNALYELPVPVIAAVNGPAIGTGFKIASLCDMRLASTESVFALPEIDVGMLGGAKHAMRLAPQGTARMMVYTGVRITAAEALDLGIVDSVHEPELLDAAAEELAARIAAKNPAAVRLAKQGMNRMEGLSLKEAYEYECVLTSQLRRDPRAREDARAFLDGRTPITVKDHAGGS